MILVTGATGFIGRSVGHRLTRENRLWKPYEGRINNPQALRTQLAGVETVIHLAGSEWRGQTQLLQHVDVEGTERLLEESHRAGVQHLIVISRLGADAHSLQMLLRAKGEVEQRVRKSGLPYTIIRSSSAFGRGDRFFEIILSLALWSWPFVWLPGGGRMALQPLWVEDLARCLVMAVDRADMIGQTIDVAGEERWHYEQIVRQLLQTADCRRIPVALPLVTLRPLTKILFQWWWWPAVNQYFVDRFFVPELTRFDAVLHYFGFRPTPMNQVITYLRGSRRRLFRR